MKLIFLVIFLFSQSLVFGAGSSSSVDANAEYLKAEKLVKTYKFEKAIKALNKLLTETPDGYTKADIYNYLGYASRKQRAPNFEKAESYYLKALKIDPNHIGALEYLGELYYETGRVEKANELLEKLKIVAGENSEEYIELFEVINS
ncbi:MAG: tetratricopeptide repeat protein [Alphaproteobacteria bacterium]|jgi:tetratricopeptide (TPR) repeat protein|tara:strand:- start:99 stop:539 length:441 start_codon:yes stop_codon:yes gene_type:complete